ncbi:hypothetical protein [Frateuria sp. Soil773]|uniref:hypothetical protein n=1 Tax=Frateuria sp. Soil773 TaxID=1736407 RepID=UPI0012F8743A|nr:hypothetical protein [Frateuria sp. Soil773]
MGMLIRQDQALLNDDDEVTDEAAELATCMHPMDPNLLIRTAYVLASRHEEVRMNLELKTADATDDELDHIARLNGEPASFDAAAGPGAPFPSSNSRN